MELVRFADRRKYRSDERSSDEIMMTRRMFALKGLVAGGFAVLAGKLGHMQLAQSSSFETRAEGNYLKDEPIPAARGMILDRNGVVLAENRVMWQVLLTPAQLPDVEEEREYVRDQVVSALGLTYMLAIRRHAVPEGVNREFAEQIATETGLELSDVQQRIEDARDDDNVIPLRRDLEGNQVDYYTEISRRIPGVTVLNEFDYVVESNPVSATPTVLKQDIEREIALSLEANKLYLPGITVDGETLVRRYRNNQDMAHILGYVGPITEEEYEESRSVTGQSPYLRTDSVGRGGVEQAMEEELRGRRGIRILQTDARGIELAELEDRRIEPRAGRNVYLSIDVRFQRAVAHALREGIEAANQDAVDQDKEEVTTGVAVVMDPRSGEVLASVSLPGFDNQQFVDGISQEDFQMLVDNPDNPLTNKVVSGSYPPGSTLKPLLGCAGLEEGTITRETQYHCVGEIEVPTVGYESEHNTYVCWFREGHGSLAIEDAIAESCNIFFYNVGAPNQVPEGGDEPLHYFLPGETEPHYFEGLGIDLIEQYLKNEFGFGAPTGIELANETAGVVPNPQWLFQSPLREYWSVGDTINVSIGQGHLSCSPMQLTNALAALANRGILYRPRLVRAFHDGDASELDEVSPEEAHQVSINPDNLEIVRQGMRRTVTEGTAVDKFPRTGDDIPIAGKTGTADYGEAVDGSYTKQHAWFAAFAPYDDPEVVVTVLIPGGGEGSTFAVPVADAILAAYFGREPLELEEEDATEGGEDGETPDEQEPDEDAPGDVDEDETAGAGRI